MDQHRKTWNKRQTEFRDLLLRYDQHQTAISMFLSQHAQLHIADMAGTEPWSFEDAVFEGLTDVQSRVIPANGEHSIAWAIWHIARIEDVTMNILVNGSEQVYIRDNWLERMKIAVRSTGNIMDVPQVKALSQAIRR